MIYPMQQRHALKVLALTAAVGASGSFIAPRAASADELISACSSVSAKSDGSIATQTPCGPDKGQALVELGYKNTSYGQGAGFGVSSYPSAALRYGLGNDLEADAYVGSYQRVRIGDVTGHGYGDSAVGLRYRVLGTGRLTAAAIGTLTFPTGSQYYSAGKSQYELGTAASYALSRSLSIQSSIAYASLYQNPSGIAPVWYASYNPAVALVASSPNGTSFYVDGSGSTKVAPGLGPEYKLGAGVRRQLGSDSVIDVGVDDGVTSVNGQRSHAVTVVFSHLVR